MLEDIFSQWNQESTVDSYLYSYRLSTLCINHGTVEPFYLLSVASHKDMCLSLPLAVCISDALQWYAVYCTSHLAATFLFYYFIAFICWMNICLSV
jgi:hypothetical protein